MRSVGEDTRDGLLALCAGLLAWGLATALLALLVPSFALALLGLALLNLLALPFAWRCRTIPGGLDTESADAQPPPTPQPRRALGAAPRPCRRPARSILASRHRSRVPRAVARRDGKPIATTTDPVHARPGPLLHPARFLAASAPAAPSSA